MIVNFRDHDGTAWEVWEAHPTLLERRANRERRGAAREGPDRRVRSVAGFTPGWLVFKSDTTRRRLRWIPDGWQSMNEDELRALLLKAARPSGALGRAE